MRFYGVFDWLSLQNTRNIVVPVFNILFFCNLVQSFNLDAKFPVFFKNPLRQSSYFGYAVDYFVDSNEAWVVVGAPNSRIDGDVYRCTNSSNELSGFGVCEVIVINKRNSPNVKQMFGSTLSFGAGKQLLSCAPKFTRSVTSSSNVESYYPIGACYLIDDFTDARSQSYDYLPCYNTLGNGNGLSHGFCQAGFSATFLKENTEVLLGAVGSYYNQGSIMVLTVQKQNILELGTFTNEHKPTIPDDWPGQPKDYYQQTYDNNYLGYSVAVGKTFANMTLLATSAPRRLGFDLLGAVAVYDEQLRSIIVNFTGKQIGEYFGHGLAFVDVNGDALDDLIVGSPLYTDEIFRQPEVGRIYIYYQQQSTSSVDSKEEIMFAEPIVINGNVSMARFGNTITSLGDVNGDDYQDFLVSAPYERGDEQNYQYGALYVFNGGKNGVSRNPSQIIRGVNLEELAGARNNIRGLGFSIKGGKDMDRNGYPDIVAGAYLSDHAVLIHARPVVKLVVKSSIHPKEIDLDTQTCEVRPGVTAACFEVHSCFSYEGKSLPPSIEFFYSYDVDSTLKEDEKRAYQADSSTRSMVLNADSTDRCVDETVYLKKDVKEKLKPISVTISYWLEEKNVPIEPVLDVITGTSSTVAAEMYKNCGDDNICTPNLQVTSDVNPSTAVIGTYTEVLISSTVSNDKENAYQTLLVVQYPDSASFINVKENIESLTHCLDVNQTVVCEVANPLKHSEEFPVDLLFGIHDLDGELPQLVFEVFANCSNERSYVSNSVSLSVDVKVEAHIQIFNASSPEIVALDKLTDEVVNKTGSLPVSHTYEITNTGPSSIHSADISLLWPLKLQTGELLFGLVEVVTSGPVTCNAAHVINETSSHSDVIARDSNKDDKSSSTSVTYYNCVTETDYCSEITCSVDALKPKKDILITLRGRLRVGPLLAGVTDSIITSNLVFHVLSYPYRVEGPQNSATSEVSTAALYPQTPASTTLDWWIIALAVAGGVLFLLIIIIILWKCGFFKRKTIPIEQDQDQQQRLYQAELIEKEPEVLQ